MKYVTEKGNQVIIGPPNIKRKIKLKEVRETAYWDMAELAKIFNHQIVEMHDGVWRWKPNRFIDWIQDYAPVYTPSNAECNADKVEPYTRHNTTELRASLSLNVLVCDLHAGKFSMEEWMKFYMQMGYSLCGYAEVFGQHEASEYDLPDAKPVPDDHDGNNYVETVLDYMRRVHKGKVLKL